MDDFKYVIVIKLYNPTPKPLDCSTILSIVAEVRKDVCCLVSSMSCAVRSVISNVAIIDVSIIVALCMQAVTQAYKHGPPSESPWKVVLYEQWIGDLTLKNSVFAYLKAEGASGKQRDITLIEITSNVSAARSKDQMEAALGKLTDMYKK